MLNDIATHQDVRRLVDHFYTSVSDDALLAPFFSHINFEEHKPRMIHFWAFVLLDEPGYTTNIFDKHAHMNLSRAALQRWIELFELSARQLFRGEKTEQAILRAKTLARQLFRGEKTEQPILRAKTIAWTFQEKMKLE